MLLGLKKTRKYRTSQNITKKGFSGLEKGLQGSPEFTLGAFILGKNFQVSGKDNRCCTRRMDLKKRQTSGWANEDNHALWLFSESGEIKRRLVNDPDGIQRMAQRLEDLGKGLTKLISHIIPCAREYDRNRHRNAVNLFLINGLVESCFSHARYFMSKRDFNSVASDGFMRPDKISRS